MKAIKWLVPCLAAVAGALSAGFAMRADAGTLPRQKSDRMWGVLIHLGMNMWADHKLEIKRGDTEDYTNPWRRCRQEILDHMGEQYCAAKKVRFDETLWREISEGYANAGVNAVILDLGEAVIYPSHPEIAVEGSWTPDKLKAELRRLRSLGFEVIPKLNFSAMHDAWLGVYERMISTPPYYKVCADLIGDVCEIFGRPKYFHVGMDEEVLSAPNANQFMAMRQGDLWWHDLNFYLGEIRRRGVTPMMWIDHIVEKPELTKVYERLPKDVVLMPWYYESIFHYDVKWELRGMRELDKRGYIMCPCGSEVFFHDDNVELLVDWCEKRYDTKRIPGYFSAPWLEMAPWAKERLVKAGESIGRVRRRYDRYFHQTTGVNDR